MRWLTTGFLFSLTAAAEIFGCFAVFLWLRAGRAAWWLVPGAVSLALFAWLLTRHPESAAGRVYAAYGGVYIVASLLWLWIVEQKTPDRWDVAGPAIRVVGAAVMVLGPRG